MPFSSCKHPHAPVIIDPWSFEWCFQCFGFVFLLRGLRRGFVLRDCWGLSIPELPSRPDLRRPRHSGGLVLLFAAPE
jgi:hypothetical protein